MAELPMAKASGRVPPTPSHRAPSLFIWTVKCVTEQSDSEVEKSQCFSFS